MTQICAYDLVGDRTRQGSRLLIATAAVLAGSLALVTAAQLRVFVPGLAAPITAQTLVCVILGMVLGPRLGAAAAVAYLGEVLAFPALSASGNIALTGGYIAGFIPAAWIAGSLFARGFGRTLPRAVIAMTLAQLAVFAVGVPWLSFVANIGLVDAVAVGFVPYLAAEVVKIALAVGMMRGTSVASAWLEERLAP